MFVFEFNGGKVVINPKEPYKLHQPMFGHSKPAKRKTRRCDKWVDRLIDKIGRER
jgi:hypothetical protein